MSLKYTGNKDKDEISLRVRLPVKSNYELKKHVLILKISSLVLRIKVKNRADLK